MTNNTRQTTGLKRKTIDKYYTSEDIVNKCIKFVKDTINIQVNDICIEPSAKPINNCVQPCFINIDSTFSSLAPMARLIPIS